ncbi:lactosylceramide 1,3-N-acetyl-beta-D-glucosaminyltransferase A-like [Lingula anatina]|uniref:Hexosyltransferase n=1 Tax=Lingula anatina TaxID=7574 RepID=A0A1S3J9Q3_LINAN|nr:lactosylceramide 1,3-N-acetyl-beta-D-glucosaminyltransferase A-like [Lingula anatina]XP_013407132.1 lactosylceramide 1,3-N-acetyl-beta-D-glucosaminyltransferase A-like [Lingula anatina]XP_013407133.1 lactosylceramide 1,3-N-acetyl-beta-D-glucosaminyltransferase A-like [Lingula anatina]XP_023932646.1 lactosylceramide 1,3-N-acetyl-beta-D-glucosaminyltransferase A-like [Lingula anatina]|eukprot:XP_013407130.1 lactosylceramide 1,3-N-acetyl-beta-D-glucosaminyltransferase A-like [Lingula anatina]
MVRKHTRTKLYCVCQISVLILAVQGMVYFFFLDKPRLLKAGPRLEQGGTEVTYESLSPGLMLSGGGRLSVNLTQGRGKLVSLAPGQKRVERSHPLGPYEGPNQYYGKHSVKYQISAHKLEVEGANLHEFNYYMKPRGICDIQREVFLLIIIHSRPENFKNRNIIRKTWGSPEYFLVSGSRDSLVKTVFVLGLSLNNTIDARLDQENALYHDLIQEDYRDHYRNMTYKHMASFKWISQNCNNSKYVLKADDDVMADIFTVVRLLQHLPQAEKEKDFIMGAITTPSVYRKKNTQWYVTTEEYRDNTYQTYPMGLAYVTTTRAVNRMFRASLTTPFYWIDDVYVGILAAKVGGVNFRRINGKMALWFMGDIDKTFLKRGYYFAHLQSPGVHFMWTIFNRLLSREHVPSIKIPKK